MTPMKISTGGKAGLFLLVLLSALFLSAEFSVERVFAQTGSYLLASVAPVEVEDPQKVREATALLHVTGVPPDVDPFTWRLKVTGRGVDTPLLLTYGDLKKMQMIERNVVLICPGVFTDRADWEGVPLAAVLDRAGVHDDYESILFHGIDGYETVFDRQEVDQHLLFLALKVNGVTLPKEHGFPVRLVAEDVLGGKWVKWIDYIEVR
jgi:DMSO/TMAO reductase YedYZ molybdopterin-dependent catalytic subunit